MDCLLTDKFTAYRLCYMSKAEVKISCFSNPLKLKTSHFSLTIPQNYECTYKTLSVFQNIWIFDSVRSLVVTQADHQDFRGKTHASRWSCQASISFTFEFSQAWLSLTRKDRMAISGKKCLFEVMFGKQYFWRVQLLENTPARYEKCFWYFQDNSSDLQSCRHGYSHSLWCFMYRAVVLDCICL